jgi:hypothetical protein
MREFIINGDTEGSIKLLSSGFIPNKWRKDICLKTDTIEHWLQVLDEKSRFVREWLSTGSLQVYPANLFFKYDLFYLNVMSGLAKKVDDTPDNIKLMHSFISEKDVETLSGQGYICKGFRLVNSFYDISINRLTKTGENYNCPYIMINIDNTETDENEESEEGEEDLSEKTIPVPVHSHDSLNPLFTMNIKYDLRYRPEYWIGKAIKIKIDA